MTYTELLNALVIDPEANSRSTLHGLLKNDQQYQYLVYNNVSVSNTLESAETLTCEDKPFDVVFISSKFPLPDIGHFITMNKARDPYGGICHIIVNNETNSHDGLLVAQGLAIGANSFLIYPCSVEKLRVLTTIAQRIKIEASERMIEASLIILIDNILKEIKERVEALYDDKAITRYSDQLKSAVKFLLKENKKTWKRYWELLTERTSEGKPRIILPKERLPRSKTLRDKVKQRQANKSI